MNMGISIIVFPNSLRKVDTKRLFLKLKTSFDKCQFWIVSSKSVVCFDDNNNNNNNQCVKLPKMYFNFFFTCYFAHIPSNKLI